jgi:hypothetical protein
LLPLEYFGARYIFLLAFFGTSAEQDYKSITILAKINTVSRSEIDPAFENALSDTFGRRKITLLHSDESSGDLARGRRIEPIEPFGIRAVAISADILSDCDLTPISNAFVTIGQEPS